MQLNLRVQALIACLALTLPFTARPAPAMKQEEIAANIKKTIEARFPGAHVLEVQPSAVPGLYELFMGDEIVYTDASADYVFIGNLLDTQTHDNLTEARLNEHGKIDFSVLPLDRAIKIVKGN